MRLAIGAMTNDDQFGINFRFVSNVAAKAIAINLHIAYSQRKGLIQRWSLPSVKHQTHVRCHACAGLIGLFTYVRSRAGG